MLMLKIEDKEAKQMMTIKEYVTIQPTTKV